MKKTIKRFWSVGLVLVLLVSMLITVVPASVSAAALAWSAAGIPNPAGSNQILASDISIVRVAPNGDIFAVDSNAAPDAIYKSVNGGLSWVKAVTPFTAAEVVADLQISPNYAADNTAVALVNTTAAAAPVYAAISTNGGTTFVKYGGNIVAAGTELGTSIAFDPTYTYGAGEIAVATADTAVAPGYGDIYTWGTGGTLSWDSLAAPGNDYTTVAFSPMYPIDTTLVAIGTDAAAGTTVNLKVGTAAWNTVSDTVAFPLPLDAAAREMGDAGAVDIISTAIAFPSDFNAAIPSTRNFFVGISRQAAVGDVYRVANATSAALGLALPTYSVAFDGTYAAGTLYAGTVGAGTTLRYCANANAPAAWVWATPNKAPTGGGLAADTTSVAFYADEVYAGTTGTESAFNVSFDGAVNFVQKGLIDTTFVAAAGDLAQMVKVSDTHWFVTNQPGVAVLDAIWETTDAGASYVRIYTMPAVANTGELVVSPNFAEDQTMYYFEPAAGAGLGVLRMSQDGGKTWTPRALPTGTAGGVSEMVVIDEFTVYAADSGSNRIYKSVNNGWTWTAQTVTAAGAGWYQLKLDTGTGALLAGDIARGAFISTDGSTWKSLGIVGAVGAGASNVVVAFDADYANNNLVYAGFASGAAGSGVYRADASAAVVTWVQIEATIPAGATADITVSSTGVLYATDATAAAGMMRILDPTAGMPRAAYDPTPENVAGVAAATFGALNLEGSAVYAIDTTGNAIYTFTDTLDTAIPNKALPTADAIVRNADFAVTIEPVTGATAYQLQWNTRDDWAGTGAWNVAFAGFPTYTAVPPAPPAPTVPAGATISYRVRVSAPYFGPWSDTFSVETQLAPAGAPNAPIIVSIGAEGGTGAGGWGVPLQPAFYWGTVTGATTYEFQLATDTAFSNLLVDATGGNALGDVTAYQYTADTLDYNTTYFWRVRALSATSQTSWSDVQGFTTMEEVEEPQITQPTGGQPTVTFTQPPATTVTFEIPDDGEDADSLSSGMLWAIIVIGAVLVIALIVLIVRTRRSV